MVGAGVTNALGGTVRAWDAVGAGRGLMVFRVDMVLFPRIGSSPNCPSVTFHAGHTQLCRTGRALGGTSTKISCA